MAHATIEGAAGPAPEFAIDERDGTEIVSFTGAWTVGGISAIDARLRGYAPSTRDVRFDLSRLDAVDTAGAWLIVRCAERLRHAGADVSLEGADAEARSLIDRVSTNVSPLPEPPARPPLPIYISAEVGEALVDAAKEARNLLGFFGLTLVTLGRAFLKPSRLRVTPLVFHMEQVGFNAVPIVSLMAFLIGVVLAYQGATQLRQFGAEVFTVDLIAISVLREIGILLTAIIVAGRSGSAFTAQIGSMKVAEEIDAMRTLGLDPMEMLVLPRFLALVVMLPILGFIADIMGLFGGAVMAWTALDITPAMFFTRLNEGVPQSHFWVGIVKAPFFAAIIAIIGCFEGMKVTGSAESVGRLTTQSVVEAIFMVILADAGFSIFFSVIGY